MLRCAIYTRKSHEEGLDQAFNSLDAQYEAGLDYIRSQKHEGWQPINHRYDDGGFSGGNMERPGLRQLLEDIRRGRIDVVVVYKVDRLSRSLHDFAKMMQVFDEHSVSFVSVTQQFNTTTSMGRLILNMLLSFAQFEREVTGERIRDKLAATKKKGLWVTGQPPLGYAAIDQKLQIIQEEAELVRQIFEGYLSENALMTLSHQLTQRGHTTKRWTSRAGHAHGGARLTAKYLYRVLTHPIYIGKMTHNEHVWPGQHEPIVPQNLWDQVQATIAKQEQQSRHRWVHSHLLKGKIWTNDGCRISPTSVQNSKKGSDYKRLIPYYVSQKAVKHGYAYCPIKTLNAPHLDELVRTLVLDYLRNHESFAALQHQEAAIRDHWLREMIHAVRVGPEQLTIELDPSALDTCKACDALKPVEASAAIPPDISVGIYQPDIAQRGRLTVLTLAIQIKRLDGKRLLLSPDGHDLIMPAHPDPKPHLVTAIGQAFYWKQLLEESSESIERVSDRLPVSERRVRKILPLILLSPDILKQTLTGNLPPSITLDDLLHAAEHLDWAKQRQDLGLAC